MAASSYTRAALLSSVFDDTVHANLANQVDTQDAINRAVREVYLDVDLKSAKRWAAISPNVFDDIFEYTAPSDLKDYAIIDVAPQASENRTTKSRTRLVTPEAFDRKKSARNLQVAIRDDDLTRVLLIDIDVDDTIVRISAFDSLTSDGSNWAAFGDATPSSIAIDQTNKVQGGASIRFDLTGSGTTAGIYNSDFTDVNVGTDIFNNGYALVWVYINSTTNLTNFILRLGNDASNYHETAAATTDSAGNAFVNGWNLIRWNWADKSTTGTVDPSLIDYCVLYMTKTSGKSDDGYRFDNLQCHSGEIYNILYYSKFPWQSAGAYVENSIGTTDYINADLDEVDLIGDRVGMEISRRLRDWEQYKVFQGSYIDKRERYKFSHPSERLQLETEYWRL